MRFVALAVNAIVTIAVLTMTLVGTQGASAPPARIIFQFPGVEVPSIANITAIAVDAGRNLYIAGDTRDRMFRTTPGAFNRKCGTDGQCGASYNPRGIPNSQTFVMKVGADGLLKLSTFIGGDGVVKADHIALGPDGSIYIAGNFSEADYPVPLPFPLTHAVVPACGEYDAFVAKLDPTASSLMYATCIQGPTRQRPIRVSGLAVDAAGSAIIGGNANNPDFPLLHPIQSVHSRYPAFVTKLSPTGQIVFSTILGGSSGDAIWSLAVDKAGDIYVAGDTPSPDFPVARPFQAALRGPSDAFVAKIDHDGRFLVFSTLVGGDFTDVAWGVAADQDGGAWIVGDTHSIDFPTTADGLDPVSRCGRDAWCAVRNPAAFFANFDHLGRLQYSTLVAPQTVNPGAPGGARLTHVFVGPHGEVDVAGDAGGDVQLVRPLTTLSCSPSGCGYLMTLSPNREIQFASRLVVGDRVVSLESAGMAIGPRGELYVITNKTPGSGQQIMAVDVNVHSRSCTEGRANYRTDRLPDCDH
jgi:hypothetical protein